MRQLMIAAAATLAATQVHAAGIDRARTPIDVLYEQGNHAKLSFSYGDPAVSGGYPAAFGGGSTADMSPSYTNLGFAYKHQFTDRLAVMVALGQPYGADANYVSGVYTGLRAEWRSTALTALAKYQATDRMSVYGGARIVHSTAEIDIPPALIGAATAGAVVAPYSAKGAGNTAVGWVLGAAYEIPDIAMRVGLTYESSITHDYATTEILGGATTTGITNVELPQSVTLDFQTGIAPDTLLFGSVRWAEWSEWEIRPPTYAGATAARITGFDDDKVTWSLGVGRQINEELSLFARAGYESPSNRPASRLKPTDGYTSFGIGGTYKLPNAAEITAGVEYVSIGDAVDTSGTVFDGNDAIGVGVQFGMSF